MNPFDAEQWESVTSSNLAAVGTRGNDLIVQFKNGDFYRYSGLADELQSLISADSVGRYFASEIKNQASQRLSEALGWSE